MKIKFKKPAPGYAYFENDSADLTPEQSSWLVSEGYAILIPKTEGDDNELPDDLPGRTILYNSGIKTIEDVQKITGSLTELKGVGKKLAAEIIAYISAPLPE